MVTPRGTAGASRRWLWPAAAVVVAALLLDRDEPFDLAELAGAFAEGRVEDALAQLAAAPPGALPAPLQAVRWWPGPTRRQALDELRRTPAGELLEAPDAPTIVSPLDRCRQPPHEVRLREPAPRDLLFELFSLELDLPVCSVPVPAGSQRIDPGVGLLPGTAYVMTLREPDAGPLLAAARFEWLSAREAEAAGIAMATARDLAGPGRASPGSEQHGRGGELLAALVALQLGLHGEALARLRPLEDDPAFAATARELSALCLLAQGLDASALRRL